MKIALSLTQIEYVLAVHKFGHFAKASEHCNVTQPTLSMQIQKLEEDLGVKLFDRSKKPILTTDVGLKMIEKMKIIQSQIKSITDIADHQEADMFMGELKLGVIPTITPYVIPELIQLITHKHPGIHLTVIEMQTKSIIEGLQNDDIDVGLLATPLKINQIHEYPLYYEPFMAFCSQQHPLAKHSKLKHTHLKFDDIWLLEDGHCLRNQIIDICSLKDKRSDKSSYQFQGGSIETIKRLVTKVGGYTLLPQMAAPTSQKNTKVISFEKPIPAREVGLVYRREHFKIHLIEALGETIIACLPPEIQKIRRKDLEVIPV